jgi:hypothetical protein
MKKWIVLFVSLYMCCTASAQLGISYQFSTSNSKIGISYDFDQKLWANVGMYDGVYIEDFTFDFSVMYNAVSKERHDLYLGAGGVVNRFEGFIFPVGARIRPVKDFPDFSLQIEASPMYELNAEDLIFFCSVGVRYTFGKRR